MHTIFYRKCKEFETAECLILVKKEILIDFAFNIADTSCSLIPPISIPTRYNLVEMQGKNREFRDLPALNPRSPIKLLTIKIIIVNVVFALNSSAFADISGEILDSPTASAMDGDF